MGGLWIDRLSEGLSDTGERLAPEGGERIIRLVAHHVGAEVHIGSPRVSAELPGTGERFEGLLPPVVAAPAFAIRKPAVAVFTLDDYVAAGIMTAEQASALRGGVATRANVLVAGGTSTGKKVETLALRRVDGVAFGRIVMRHRPSAIGVVAVSVIFRSADALDHAVQRDMFDDPDLSHGSFPSFYASP